MGHLLVSETPCKAVLHMKVSALPLVRTYTYTHTFTHTRTSFCVRPLLQMYMFLGGGLIMRHYTIASKLTREHILEQFTNHAYVLPAEEKVACILAEGARPNIYDFEAPSQKPRARVFPLEETKEHAKRVKLNSPPPSPQQCRNARLKKR
jgi:hypothetical protein